MTVVDDARDVALHERPAQLLVLDPLADRRLHQVRAGEEDRAGALDDVRLVAHDRQVGAAGDARAHDRRHLEDALGGEAGVVVEGAAEVLAVGEDLVLERQEDAGRVDQVDDRQPVLERDLLGAQHLLAGQREPGAGLDRGVVRHDDHVAPVDRRRSRRRPPPPGRRRTPGRCRRPPRGPARGTARPGRRGRPPARGPSSSPAPAGFSCAFAPPPRRRRFLLRAGGRPRARQCSARRAKASLWLTLLSSLATIPPVPGLGR